MSARHRRFPYPSLPSFPNFNLQLGFIYLFAFSSLYIQFPGLYGYNGLLPLHDLVANMLHPSTSSISSLNNVLLKHPSIILLSPDVGVSVDGLAEFILMIGIISSIFVVMSAGNSHILFAILWICYLSMVILGETFMSFQWDILLLEVGFLTALILPKTKELGKFTFIIFIHKSFNNQ